MEQLRDSIISQVGREFNINSPKQLGEVLFEGEGPNAVHNAKVHRLGPAAQGRGRCDSYEPHLPLKLFCKNKIYNMEFLRQN